MDGSELKEIRIILGLDQYQMAVRIGLQRRAYARFENGQSRITPTIVLAAHYVLYQGSPADQIRDARRQLGLTQKELGEKIFKDQRTVQKYECNRVQVSQTVELAVKRLLIEDQVSEERNE